MPSCIVDRRGITPRGKTKRFDARDFGSADPQDPFSRAQTWVGDRQAHPANLQGCAAGATRLALPGAVSARAASLDQSRVEENRHRAGSKVLCADGRWPETARKGAGDLEPIVRCDQSRHPNYRVRGYALV